MYNMNVSIFGYKLKVEILILFAFIVVILLSHTLFGSYNGMEGLENMENSSTDVSGNDNTVPAPSAISTKAKANPTNMNGILTESFVGANTNYGQSSQYDLASQTVIDTSSWNAPNMTVVPGKPLSDGVKKFLAREPQPVPLPEGELDMFATTPFKPECCPNTYSNSTGCACMTGEQYNWLVQRGGNNVPYSEY
jgi:hypothetical protein